jgi:hypothetical protein
MVDYEVLLANRRKALAGVLADTLGKTCVIGFELKVRAVNSNKLDKLIQGQHPVHDEDVFRGHVKFLCHEAKQGVGHTRSRPQAG